MSDHPPGPRNLVTDVPGIRVGQASDARLKSGVTVVTGPAPMVAGVHVMGGAPGTRETDLLRPDTLVGEIDAIVLSGGSAFGLGAAEGVMAGLREAGRGFAVGPHRVPIVPAAILFDLEAGGAHGWQTSPYPDLGRAAFDHAGGDVVLGSAGAGTGATAGRLKGGIGSASARMGDATVGALVAANPVGSVVHPETGQFWAAPFEFGEEFGGRGVPPGALFAPKDVTAGGHTTIAVIATDIALDKAAATRLAIAAHDGMARAILPSHTPFDGDLVFAVSTGRCAAPDPAGMLVLCHLAATCLARAIARGVHSATPAPGDRSVTWAGRYG